MNVELPNISSNRTQLGQFSVSRVREAYWRTVSTAGMGEYTNSPAPVR